MTLGWCERGQVLGRTLAGCFRPRATGHIWRRYYTFRLQATLGSLRERRLRMQLRHSCEQRGSGHVKPITGKLCEASFDCAKAC